MQFAAEDRNGAANEEKEVSHPSEPANGLTELAVTLSENEIGAGSVSSE